MSVARNSAMSTPMSWHFLAISATASGSSPFAISNMANCRWKKTTSKKSKKNIESGVALNGKLGQSDKKKAAKEMNLTLHLSIRWLQKAGTLWLVGRACGPAMRNGKTPHFNATHDDHQDTGHFRTLDMLVAQQTCNGNTLQLSSAASPETLHRTA